MASSNFLARTRVETLLCKKILLHKKVNVSFYLTSLSINLQKRSYVSVTLPIHLAAAKGTTGNKPGVKVGGRAAPSKKKSGFKQTKKVAVQVKKSNVGPGFAKVNEKFYQPPPVVDLDEMYPEAFLYDNVGKVYAITDTVLSKIKTFRLPPALNHELEFFPRPSLVIRESSVKLIDLLEASSDLPSLRNRIILCESSGELGTGKSTLLLQSVCYALSSNWIVIYISHAISYVNSSSAYQKVEATGEFVQPALAQKLLQQINIVNRSIFQNIKLKQSHEIQRNILKKDSPITQLIELGIREESVAFDVLTKFFAEIEQNDTYSVLLAVDEINAFYTRTKYRNVDFTFLDADRFSLIKILLEFFGGQRHFKRGAIIGAISNVFPPIQSKILDFSLRLDEPSPWIPYSQSLISYTKGLQRFDVTGYSKDEAKAGKPQNLADSSPREGVVRQSLYDLIIYFIMWRGQPDWTGFER
ncbi:6127_t:CDS:10 [Ambispora leptoticha]|uniref:Small ribosomal subunit protein mS29 n=1 Tax=Ambispora leptoticha TaxID=144679 RepID=A0A9N9FD30_9GLOM|nr:6127_t:CDS:10 [Ambispora leptoticha]